MSFETIFNSKQPKLEPKLVSALSETRLFRFYTETESFDVSIEPKQTEDQPKEERKKGRTFILLGQLLYFSPSWNSIQNELTTSEKNVFLYMLQIGRFFG